MTAVDLALELARLDTINPPGNEWASAEKIDAAADGCFEVARRWCGL